MNWERGLQRVAYLFIALVWVVTIVSVGADSSWNAAALGYTIPWLLLFTLVFMLAYMAVRWVVRGFRSDR